MIDPVQPAQGRAHDLEEKHEEEQALLDRLDRRLGLLYPRNERGGYDWHRWDAQTAARLEAAVLVDRPDLWEKYIHLSTRSRHAWRVLQLSVEALWERSWTELLIAPGQELTTEPGSVRWSPLFRWIIAVAVGNIKPGGRRGRDPAKLVWRDLALYHTVWAFRSAGLRPATSDKPGRSACHIVADNVGLGYDRVRQIWLRFRALESRFPG